MPVLVLRVRPKTFPLLRLPREIRDLIYELILVEPPKHQRRHIATCSAASLSPSSPEIPPFVTEEKAPFPRFLPFGDCRCANRRHLALLLTNRQVYEEGSRVLWTKNVFSFHTIDSFNQWFAHISAAKRRIIRYIAIYLLPRSQWQHLSFSRTIGFDVNERLLQNLVQCVGLRKLDLGPAQLPSGFIAALSRQLPLLKSLRVAGFVDVADRLPWVWGLVHTDVRIDGVDIMKTSTSSLESQWDIGIWIARIIPVIEKLTGRLGRDKWEGYCDTNSTAKLRLPDEPHPIEVPLIGLPNSAATCARFRLEREQAEKLREKREAREDELRRGEAMRLAKEADRRQAAESHAAVKLRESERAKKQLKQEGERQSLQRNRHIRDHLATRKAERKRVRGTK
ncbi:hypothetical protein PG997_001547 [Apiospora hydei]|uniref:DUF7730 domain-containing protein n=1 Tax=Apiospora hydei TaxID=1337664 RepID=A0ABR1XE73_9PEZI